MEITKTAVLTIVLLASVVFAEIYPAPTNLDNDNFYIVGPFIDYADGKTTIVDTIDIADINCYLMKDDYGSYVNIDLSSNFTQLGNGYARINIPFEFLDNLYDNVNGTYKIAFDNAIVGGYSTQTILPFYEKFTAYYRSHIYPITFNSWTIVLETIIDDDTYTNPYTDKTFNIYTTTSIGTGRQVQVGDYFVYMDFTGYDVGDPATYHNPQSTIPNHKYWYSKITNVSGNAITIEGWDGVYPQPNWYPLGGLTDGHEVAIYRAVGVSLTDDSYDDIAGIITDVNTAIITKIEDVNNVITAGITALDVDIIGEIQDSNTVINNKLNAIPTKPGRPGAR